MVKSQANHKQNKMRGLLLLSTIAWLCCHCTCVLAIKPSERDSISSSEGFPAALHPPDPVEITVHGALGTRKQQLEMLLSRSTPYPRDEIVQAHYEYARLLTNQLAPELVRLSLVQEAHRVKEHARQHFLQALDLDLNLHGANGILVNSSLTISQQVEAYNTLGLLAMEANEWHASIGFFKRAIEISPESVSANGNLGLIYQKAGYLDEAYKYTMRALELQPDEGKLHHNLGNILQLRGRLEDAFASWKEAIRLDPASFHSYCSIGIYWGSKGETERGKKYVQEAAIIAERLAKAHPENSEIREGFHSMLLQLATAQLPIVYQSNHAIETARADYQAHLDAIERRADLLIVDPIPTIGFGSMGYYAIYQGKNDLPIRAELARIYRRASPQLNYVAPHVAEGRRNGYIFNSSSTEPHPSISHYVRVTSRRIRVGFLSAFMFHHSVGLLMEGVICGLDGDVFEKYLLRFPSPEDELTRRVQDCTSRDLLLELNIEDAQKQVAELELDVLVFTEIGMDLYSYFLAFSRLALRSVVFWGHAVTSGVDSIDYFVSSKLFQEPEASTKYSECVFRMNGLTTSFRRPFHPQGDSLLNREMLGLPSSPTGVMLLIPQTLYKLHPDLDPLLENILYQATDAFVVFPVGSVGGLVNQIQKRWRRTLSTSIHQRIFFVRQLNSSEFLQLCAMADVVLDPFPVGGGRSSFEIFSVGTPIVMLYPRTSILQLTYAMYQQMGILDAIAYSDEAFVEIAVKLASDTSARRELRARILRNNHVLYGSRLSILEWEYFLLKIMALPPPEINSDVSKHCPFDMPDNPEVFNVSFHLIDHLDSVSAIIRQYDHPSAIAHALARSVNPPLDFLKQEFIGKVLWNAQNRINQSFVGVFQFEAALHDQDNTRTIQVEVRYGDDLNLVCHHYFAVRHGIQNVLMIQQAAQQLKARLPEYVSPEWIATRQRWNTTLEHLKLHSDSASMENCVTLLMTTCKRLDLFIRTVRSLQQAIGDKKWATRFCSTIVVDDNSSLEDRQTMLRSFPDFEFVFKPAHRRGHAVSLNMGLRLVRSRYVMYLEDDWEVVGSDASFIDHALRILQHQDHSQASSTERIVQVLLNDQNGGWARTLVDASASNATEIQYRLHEFGTTDPEHTFAYWPGFSLNPGLWDWQLMQLNQLDQFPEHEELFERIFSLRVWRSGLSVAYLTEKYAVHIGAEPGSNKSAYVLNGMPRFFDLQL